MGPKHFPLRYMWDTAVSIWSELYPNILPLNEHNWADKRTKENTSLKPSAAVALLSPVCLIIVCIRETYRITHRSVAPPRDEPATVWHTSVKRKLCHVSKPIASFHLPVYRLFYCSITHLWTRSYTFF